MGAVDSRLDARANGDFKQSLILSLEILNRKSSKKLMALEIAECLSDLQNLGEKSILPSNFEDYSVYGQRDILNKICLEETE